MSLKIKDFLIERDTLMIEELTNGEHKCTNPKAESDNIIYVIVIEIKTDFFIAFSISCA